MSAQECWVGDCAFPRVDDVLCELHGGTPVGQVYTFAWRNNARRAELYGRRCVIEATGTMSTALVRFLDTGEKVTTSKRALRKYVPKTAPGVEA